MPDPTYPSKPELSPYKVEKMGKHIGVAGPQPGGFVVGSISSASHPSEIQLQVNDSHNHCLDACEAHYQPYVEALRELVEARKEWLDSDRADEHRAALRMDRAYEAARQLLDGEGGGR